MDEGHSNLTAALELAAKGWHILPCRHRDQGHRTGKSPLTLNGFHDATTDPEAIARWWQVWPEALIGAVVPDPVIVIDVDPRNGGSLEALQNLTGALPETLTVWSGRGDGGRHLYFKRPAVSVSAKRLPDGIDLKHNGYLIMPPSRHPETGQPYRWQPARAQPLPSALRRLLTVQQSYRPRAVAPAAGSLAALARFTGAGTKGDRNDRLYWAARRAFEAGAETINEIAEAAMSTGLTQREVDSTIGSARDAVRRQNV